MTSVASSMDKRPLGAPAYGSIPHLPSSRRGPGDRGLNPGQTRILTERARDNHDIIICQQKLDGSCVAVYREPLDLGWNIVAIGRAGYTSWSSPYLQHHKFAWWAETNMLRFRDLLLPGERVVGEWMAQAHGTKYRLTHEPFVPFDIIGPSGIRLPYFEFQARVKPFGFTVPQLISYGPPISVEEAVRRIDPAAHGALDPVEGCVWRCERNGIVDFLGKWVRPDKVDGCYLPEKGKDEIWNEGLPLLWGDV